MYHVVMAVVFDDDDVVACLVSVCFDVVYAVGDFLGAGKVVVALWIVGYDDVAAAEFEGFGFLG